MIIIIPTLMGWNMVVVANTTVFVSCMPNVLGY